MSADFELMQEYLPPSVAEKPCPGFDVCPVSMCGCFWLATGSPWRESPPDDLEATPKSQA